jgi:hypothetical protein
MILYGNQGIMVTTESLGIVAFSGALAAEHSVQQLSCLSRQVLFIKLEIRAH